jgi:hypothetical protein
MIRWYDLGIIYFLAYLPSIIWGEQCISWLDLSSSQKRYSFAAYALAFIVLNHYFWFAGFEYTMEQYKQLFIGSGIAVVFKIIYHIFKPKS